jgi:hypothetical protein
MARGSTLDGPPGRAGGIPATLRSCLACIVMSTGIAVAALLILACYQWPDEAQPLLDSEQPLAPGEAHVQPLSLSKEGVYRIDVAMFRRGAAVGQVVLRLTADPDGTDELAMASTPVERAEDVSVSIRRPYTYVAFELPADKTVPAGQIWLRLELRTSVPIVLRGTESPEHEFNVAIKTYYRRSFVGNLAILLSRLGERGVYLGAVVFVYAVLLASLCHACRLACPDGPHFAAGSLGSELPHGAWARRSLGKKHRPIPVILSEAKNLALAGVEILRRYRASE